jgi:hypothetical protein
MEPLKYCKLSYKASCFIMHHQKEDTGVTCLFINGIQIINKTKIRLFFFSELSESSFGSFSITRTFKIYCLIFLLLNELLEGKQSNYFSFKFKSKCTTLHRVVIFFYNLSFGHFAVTGIVNCKSKQSNPITGLDRP